MLFLTLTHWAPQEQPLSFRHLVGPEYSRTICEACPLLLHFSLLVLSSHPRRSLIFVQSWVCLHWVQWGWQLGPLGVEPPEMNSCKDLDTADKSRVDRWKHRHSAQRPTWKSISKDWIQKGSENGELQAERGSRRWRGERRGNGWETVLARRCSRAGQAGSSVTVKTGGDGERNSSWSGQTPLRASWKGPSHAKAFLLGRWW